MVAEDVISNIRNYAMLRLSVHAHLAVDQLVDARQDLHLAARLPADLDDGLPLLGGGGG